MMRSRFRVILALASAILPVAASAQEPQSVPADTARVELQAVRTPNAPVIDGVLEDEVWATVPAAATFLQRQPDEGQPATEQTTVRVVYDDEAIYFGARLDDSSGKPTTRLGRRDSWLESDWFRVYLDPHLDRRTGAAFWVNPSNVQVDMVLYNDTGDDWDWDAVWDSAAKIDATGWTVEMKIPFSQLRFPDRPVHIWGANFARGLNRKNESSRWAHSPKIEQGFVSRFGNLTGIQNIKPKRAFELLPYAVLRSDVSTAISEDDPFNDRTEFDEGLGLDLKYGLTSNLTLTGTINPDFGQVEVDPAVVNLTQFELFFPEKRPFFIEGSNLFSFGRGGSNHDFSFNFSEPTFFYSRRIGRQPQGLGRLDYSYIDAPTETTILGAAKITGKTGNGWTIAALDALTDKEEARIERIVACDLTDPARPTGCVPCDPLDANSEGCMRVREGAVVEPRTNYFVSRVAKDLGTKGRIGFLGTATNRSLPDELEYLREGAYLGGIDGYWFFGDKDVILEWLVAGTRVEGSEEAIRLTQRSPARYYQRPDADHVELDPSRTSLDGWGSRVMLAKQTGRWKYNLQAQTYSPGFETNDVGFMQRSDATAAHAVLIYRNENPVKIFREQSYWIGKYNNWNTDGDVLADGVNGSAFTMFTNYWYAYGNAGFQNERFDDRKTRGGPLVEEAPLASLSAGVGSDERRAIAFELNGNMVERDDGGSAERIGLFMKFKPRNNVSIRVGPSYDHQISNSQYVRTVADPAAVHTYSNRYIFSELDQRTFELSTRIDWTFTSRLTLQMYVQPFISSGDYEEFKELSRPASRDYAIYGEDAGTIAYDEETDSYFVDPDGAGVAGTFRFDDPDFNFRSVRGSAVARWEFRPGSSLYVVWNENRATSANRGDFDLSRDLSALGDADSDDVFLVKMSYWLPL